jgi:hypothetical protein
MVLDSFEPEDIKDSISFLVQVRKIIPKYEDLLQFIERFEPFIESKVYSDFIIKEFVELNHLKTVSLLQKYIIEEHLKVVNPQLLYIY